MEFCVKLLSLPLWERGLKLWRLRRGLRSSPVAPLVGAWIEILYRQSMNGNCCVAPLVGAWIEIYSGDRGLDPILCRSPCGSVD